MTIEDVEAASSIVAAAAAILFLIVLAHFLTKSLVQVNVLP
jgi:hypothetical protein